MGNEEHTDQTEQAWDHALFASYDVPVVPNMPAEPIVTPTHRPLFVLKPWIKDKPLKVHGEDSPRC